MELYVTISFWLGVFVTVCRIITMASSEWPKYQEPKTLGFMCAETILGMGFAIWAGIALYVFR